MQALKLATVKNKNKERGKKMKEDKKIIGEGVGFERIRRITGYLVGTLDRFNNGKKAEERDRVKHSTEGLKIQNEK